jgi:PAS domain S-box-containing protein
MSEARSRRFVMADALGIGVAAVDHTGRQTYVNAAFAEMVGWSIEDLTGAVAPFVYWPPAEYENIHAAFARMLSNDVPPAGFELTFQRSDGSRIDVLVKVTPFGAPAGESGWVACMTDITPVKRASKQQRFLSEAGRLLASSLEYEATLSSVAHMAVPALADYCLIDIVSPTGEIKRVGIADRDEARRARLWEHWRRWPVHADDAIGIAQVLRTREPALIEHVKDSQLASYSPDPEQLASLRSMNICSSMIVPMVARGRALGVITLNSSESARSYDERDLEVAIALAERAALAVDNAMLYSAERSVRRERETAEMQLELALKSARLGHWDYEESTDSVRWDSRLRELFNIDADAVPSLDVAMAAVHPEDRERVVVAINRAMTQHSAYEAEFRVIRRDGGIRWILGQGRGMKFEDGTRLSGIVMDITQRYRAGNTQRILAEAGKILPATMDPAAVLREFISFSAGTVGDYALGYTIDANGVAHASAVAHVNPEMQHLVEQLGVIAKPPADSDHIVARAIREKRTISVLVASADEIRATATSEAHAGLLARLAPTSAVVMPLMAADRVMGACAIVRVAGGMLPFDEDDVALLEELGRRVALGIENARLYQNAQAANIAKSEFLATMSHELRTPLNAMIGYTDLMLMEVHGTLTERQREYMDRVKSSAFHQVQLVEGILGYSRMEAGREAVTRTATDALQVLREVANLVRPLAEQKGLTLLVEEPSGSIEIETDRHKLGQVLLNLAANAVKFTTTGAVTVGASAGDGEVALYVRDTGIGIDLEKLDLIFEPFVQLDQTNTRAAGGTGLGLAISRRLVDLLGGRITVQSQRGTGSLFTILLPVESSAADAH